MSGIFRTFGLAEGTSSRKKKKSELSFCISLDFSYLCTPFIKNLFYKSMNISLNIEELKEAAQDARRLLERDEERIAEEARRLQGLLQTLSATEDMLDEIGHLRNDNEALCEENEGLRQQLQEREAQLKEKDVLLKEKDIQLKELGKLSAGVAKKSSQDDVSKALRIYLNTSKRKTLSKREAAKTVFLELITAAKLELPEDIMELLNHFDDEQIVEPSQVATGSVTEDMSELFTDEAQVLWQRLRDAGFIVPDGYALAEGVSANQAAYLATAMAERLQIKKKWKLFQQLWGIANMAQLAGSWQQTGKLPPRCQEIDKAIE